MERTVIDNDELIWCVERPDFSFSAFEDLDQMGEKQRQLALYVDNTNQQAGKQLTRRCYVSGEGGKGRILNFLLTSYTYYHIRVSTEENWVVSN